MPGEMPPGETTIYRAGLSPRLVGMSSRGGMIAVAVACGTFTPPPAARAEGALATVPAVAAEFPASTAVLLLAVFIGAISFALLSAFWLIRERGRIGQENHKLKQRFAELRAERERLSALVGVNDQIIIVFDGEKAEANCLGRLDGAAGIPRGERDFLAFGRWLLPASAAELEKAIAALREHAEQFTLGITAINGAALEAQGRVSGGHAFVRFILLDGARAALAKLQRERDLFAERFELLEALFETLSAPFWINDKDGAIVFANPAYCAAVEAPSAEMVIAENRQLYDQAEREVIERERAESGHYFGRLPAVVAGDRRVLETLSVKSGHGSAGIAIDRSDAEAVRIRLKQAITSHEQSFDHLAAAVAIFDADRRLQFYNSSFQQLWGLSVPQLADHPHNGEILELLRGANQLPEIPDWHRWKESQLAIYQSTETREEHWHLPDGRTLRVIVNPQNQGGACWVFENVTEELALKSSYNALIRVQGETLDHLNEAVAVFGSDGRIRLTNPAFVRLFEFDSETSLEGRHASEISEQAERHLKSAEAWQAIHLGITGLNDDRNDISGRLELTSGTIFDYRLAHLPGGQTMLTLGDMTAAVNIERALKERNDALEESDALKSRFIQHVSYELRAPLTSIAGFAEILESSMPGRLNGKQAEYVGYISKSADVLKGLIDGILDLATIDAGAMQLNLSPVDIRAVIEDSVHAVGDKLERYQIKPVIRLGRDIGEVIGDSGRIRQIVEHLVINAVNVSPDGGVIEIAARRRDDDLEITVTDQGPGVPEALRQRIFERFETGGGGEKGRDRGAGLGLSIVKSFVELHGGSIDVEDADGGGARFVCRLPLDPPAGLQAAE